MPPRISLEEQEKILTEATRLLAEPANYVVGRWKCPVYQYDKKTGKLLEDENGKWVPEVDFFNRPVHEHCVEGAVNQAAYNVLGHKRAITVGEDRGYFNFEGDTITERLGLNALTRELHDDEYETALEMNDTFDNYDPEGHALVLGLLKEQLKRVQQKLTARKVKV